MELNELKKFLYKVNPPAHLDRVSADGLQYQVYNYPDKMVFLVPLNEIGEVKWEKEMPAKLLIRYIVK